MPCNIELIQKIKEKKIRIEILPHSGIYSTRTRLTFTLTHRRLATGCATPRCHALPNLTASSTDSKHSSFMINSSTSIELANMT